MKFNHANNGRKQENMQNTLFIQAQRHSYPTPFTNATQILTPTKVGGKQAFISCCGTLLVPTAVDTSSGASIKVKW